MLGKSGPSKPAEKVGAVRAGDDYGLVVPGFILFPGGPPGNRLCFRNGRAS